MNLTIAITTAPRKIGTLGLTISSLRTAGFACHIRIHAEPGTNLAGIGGSILQHEVKLGCLKNWDFTLKSLVDTASTNFVAVFQDDIEFKMRSASALNAVLEKPLPAEFGFFSLYTPQFHKDFCQSFGWNFGKVDWHMVGAQALVFSKESARLLLGNAVYQEHVKSYTKNEQIDSIVGLVMSRMLHRSCLWYNPSLCRHIGAELSTLKHQNAVHGNAVGFTTPSTLSIEQLRRLREPLPVETRRGKVASI
jgi:hypothetical protein